MAGASIPLTPAVHQMIDVGPVPLFEHDAGRDRLPDRPRHGHEHVRAPARQRHGGRLVRPPGDPHGRRRHPVDRRVGALADRAAVHRRRTSTRSWSRRSSSCPRSSATSGSGIRHAINGLLSLTPDGNPILGETPEVKGLWSVAAIWIKEAPGIARTVAEWMTDGEPEIDPHGSDIARFYDHQRTAQHIAARDRRGLQQDLRHRPPDGAVGVATATSGVARSTRASRSSARSSSRRPAGSARSGTSRTSRCSSEYGDRVMPRAAEWESRWWSPIINAEHLAMRDRVGDGRPVGVRDLRRHRAGRARRTSQRLARRPGRRRRRAASSTRRSSTRPAGSSPT